MLLITKMSTTSLILSPKKVLIRKELTYSNGLTVIVKLIYLRLKRLFRDVIIINL